MTTSAIGDTPRAAAESTGAVARPAASSLSRTVAVDIVALLDIAAVALGAVLPALIYARFGDVVVDFAQSRVRHWSPASSRICCCAMPGSTTPE